MRKMLSVMLIIALLLATIPAMASTEKRSGVFTYQLLNDGTVKIIKYNGTFDDNIHIPTFIDGYAVTVIGKEAFSCEGRDDIRFKSVSLTMPDTITTLEHKAFFHAPINQINIPASVTLIQPGALRTFKIVTYNLSKGNSKYALIGGNLYDKHKKEFLSWCGDYVVDIPEGIFSIADYALNSSPVVDAADSIYLQVPDSLLTIGDYAFCNASIDSRDDSAIDLKNVKSIGEYAFCGAYFSDDFILPTSIKTIPEGAFKNTGIYESYPHPYFGSEYRYFIWHDQIECIEAYAFQGADLNSTFATDNEKSTSLSRLPESLEQIEEFAFADSKIFAKEIALTTNLISVSEYAFHNAGLKKVTLPSDSYGLSANVFNKDEVSLIVDEGSYAEIYARSEGFAYSYVNPQEDDLSWLTE